MRPLSTTFILLALLASAPLGATSGTSSVITVVGLDDVGADRQNLQDAVDAAPWGATIRLLGTFQLDGERVRLGTKRLTIEGEAVDDDGDGRVQEDWLDGVDNDGDGATDEDDWETWLVGVDAGDGSPLLNDGVNGLFNRAFVVDGLVGELRGLTIRDLAFTTFHRAIELIPEWDSPTGRCEDRTQVAGSVRDLTLERNRFVNSELGVTLLGSIHSSTMDANVYQDVGIFGLVLEGGTVDCPLADGSSVELALTTPRLNRMTRNVGSGGSLGTSVTFGSRVTDNVIADGGLFVLNDRSARISRNAIAGFFGLIVDGGDSVRIDRNVVTDAFDGINASGSAQEVVLVRNEIEALFTGLFVGGSGFRAVNNTLSGSLLLGGVVLDFGSSDNTVINQGEPQTAFDFGVGNTLIGNFIFP